MIVRGMGEKLVPFLRAWNNVQAHHQTWPATKNFFIFIPLTIIPLTEFYA